MTNAEHAAMAQRHTLQAERHALEAQRTANKVLDLQQRTADQAGCAEFKLGELVAALRQIANGCDQAEVVARVALRGVNRLLS